MAITTTTQFANRYGLNIEIYAHTDVQMATPLMTIDFANVSDVDVSGDRTWATGGQDHSNKIGFNDPLQGTLKLSTQIMTMVKFGADKPEVWAALAHDWLDDPDAIKGKVGRYYRDIVKHE